MIHFLILLTISATWGSLYLFVKIYQTALPPIAGMAIRAFLSASVMGLVCVATHRSLRNRGWREHGIYFVLALLNATLLWLGLAYGVQRIPAGLASILGMTGPIFTFIFTAFVSRQESVTRGRVAGLFMALGGLILVVGVEHLSLKHAVGLGSLLVCGGFLAYALGGLFADTYTQGMDPYRSTTFMMMYAFGMLAGLSFLFENPLSIGLRAISSVAGAILGAAMIGTVIPTLLYFILLRRAGVLYTSACGYLTPIFGVLLGALFLSERMTMGRVFGMVVVLGGVYLMHRPSTVESVDR